MPTPLGVTLYEQMLQKQQIEAQQRKEQERFYTEQALAGAKESAARDDKQFDQDLQVAQLYGGLAGFEDSPVPQMRDPRLQEYADLAKRAADPKYVEFKARMKNPWMGDQIASHEGMNQANIDSRQRIARAKLMLDKTKNDNLATYQAKMAAIAQQRANALAKKDTAQIALYEQMGRRTGASFLNDLGRGYMQVASEDVAGGMDGKEFSNKGDLLHSAAAAVQEGSLSMQDAIRLLKEQGIDIPDTLLSSMRTGSTTQSSRSGGARQATMTAQPGAPVTPAPVESVPYDFIQELE